MRKWMLVLLATVLFCVATMACGCQNQPEEHATVKPTAYRPAADQFTYPIIDKYPLQDEYYANRKAFAYFERSTEPRKMYVPITQIMEYKTQYPECNSTWFKSQLSGEALCIYNTYLFALENGYTYFELYVEDDQRDLSLIRDALSLDSAFLEQNVDLHGETQWDRPPNYLGDRISVSLGNFSLDRLEKKLEALKNCRQIVAQMPATCTTQWEKAEYLYRYVCDHVKYEEYGYYAVTNYLYDAVCTGKTNCDGYSNMLSLLFHLAGIECCEVMGYNIKDWSEPITEDPGGHTWVVAKLDGNYYNFDPTWEDTKGIGWGSDLVYFGFSDRMAPVLYLENEEQRPKCTDISRDFLYADIIVEDIHSSKNAKKIAQTVESRFAEGERGTLVAVTGDVSQKNMDVFQDKFTGHLKSVEKVAQYVTPYERYTLMWLTVVK